MMSNKTIIVSTNREELVVVDGACLILVDLLDHAADLILARLKAECTHSHSQFANINLTRAAQKSNEMCNMGRKDGGVNHIEVISKTQ